MISIEPFPQPTAQIESDLSNFTTWESLYGQSYHQPNIFMLHTVCTDLSENNVTNS